MSFYNCPDRCADLWNLLELCRLFQCFTWIKFKESKHGACVNGVVVPYDIVDSAGDTIAFVEPCHGILQFYPGDSDRHHDPQCTLVIFHEIIHCVVTKSFPFFKMMDDFAMWVCDYNTTQ